ncbi:helix-turn-helix domain-containing protein (plasmid) [Borreliella tanukii]|uniref:helix-turn-helix domain-containing protein n=1 Tax=Borreliella tanukii TaxID=56146 RepID=UPI003AF0D4C1
MDKNLILGINPKIDKPQVIYGKQKGYFARVFRCVRFLYNRILSDKKDYYKKINKVFLLIQVNIKRYFYF